MTDQAASNFQEFSERHIRELVKSAIPRLLRKSREALLVEEMSVMSGKARIDLAIIGEFLLGIEIKGPKDDISRLPGQQAAYSSCFDWMFLVVHEPLLSKAAPLIPDWWGVAVSSQKDGVLGYRFERRPTLNPGLDIDSLLSLLWREEVDSLCVELLGHTPDPRSTKKMLRRDLLAEISTDILHDAGLRCLRLRENWRTARIHA